MKIFSVNIHFNFIAKNSKPMQTIGVGISHILMNSKKYQLVAGQV